MDFKKFKKVHANSTHTIFESPEGHAIHVAHQHLAEKYKKDLKSLPVQKFEEGGFVSGLADSLSNILGGSTITDVPAEDLMKYGSADQAQAATQMPAQMPTQEPQAPSNYQLPSQQPQGIGEANADPFGNQAYMQNLSQGVQATKAGIQGMAAAEGQHGREQQVAAEQNLAHIQEAQANYQQQYNALDQERQALMKDYSEGHIDPNHFLHSMDTGNKISTAIGLILGGIGAGPGGANPAMQFIQKQIDNDILAQQQNLGKKRSLLEANLQHFGHMNQAVEMTRMMMNDILKAQLAAAAGKSADPMAKARAQKEIGELDMKMAPVQGQLAMQKTLQEQMQKGGPQNSALMLRMLPHLGATPEQTSTAAKELEHANLMVDAKKRALQVFDQVSKINTLGNRALNPIQSGSQIESLVDPIAIEMAKDAAGRVNEYEFNAFKNMFTNMSNNQSTVDLKRKNLESFFKKKLSPEAFPVLNSFGMVPKALTAPSAQVNRNVIKK